MTFEGFWTPQVFGARFLPSSSKPAMTWYETGWRGGTEWGVRYKSTGTGL
jgi:hypothetical protein